MKLNHCSNNQTIFSSTMISGIYDQWNIELLYLMPMFIISYMNHVSFIIHLVWLAVAQKSLVKHSWSRCTGRSNFHVIKIKIWQEKCSLCFPLEIKNKIAVMTHDRRVRETMPDHYIHLMSHLSKEIVLHSCFSNRVLQSILPALSTIL